MKKLIVIGVMTLAAMFVALGVAPSANAYPETSCNVTVDAQKVESGTKLKVHGESQLVVTDDGLGRAAAPGTTWTATFNGDTVTKTSDEFNTTFAVPEVSTETVLTLTVKAKMTGATDACEKSLNITVRPDGTLVNPPDDQLPNTGGPRMILLIAGLGLVVAGGVAIQQSRKRHERVAAV